MNEPLPAPVAPDLAPVVSAAVMPGAARPQGARRILYGADGLRAGWSLLLYVVLIALVQWAVNAAFHHAHRLTPDELMHIARNPSDLLITNGIPLIAVVLVTFVVSRIERRPFRAYGIGPTPGAVRQFTTGLFWGAALLSLLVAILWSQHVLVFDGRRLAGTNVPRFAFEWLVGFLCVGFLEEFLTRGFLFFTVARGLAGPLRYTRLAPHSRSIGFWITAAISSYLFGAGHGHNHGESLVGLLSAGLLGAVYTVSLWRTGSLWWAIGMHASWDWAQSFLYGTPDSGHVVAFFLLGSHPQGATQLSGGLTGPEGSIYCLPIAALAAVVVLLTLRKTGWPAPGSRLSSDTSRDRPDTIPAVRP